MARSSPPHRRRFVLLAALVPLLALSGLTVWAVTTTAQTEPLGPAVSTIAPAPPPAAAPAVAPTTTAAPPTEDQDSAPATQRRSARSTSATPPSWSEDKLREAVRRLQEPTSPEVQRCLESGKLYEQCTG